MENNITMQIKCVLLPYLNEKTYLKIKTKKNKTKNKSNLQLN